MMGAVLEEDIYLPNYMYNESETFVPDEVLGDERCTDRNGVWLYLRVVPPDILLRLGRLALLGW